MYKAYRGFITNTVWTIIIVLKQIARIWSYDGLTLYKNWWRTVTHTSVSFYSPLCFKHKCCFVFWGQWRATRSLSKQTRRFAEKNQFKQATRSLIRLAIHWFSDPVAAARWLDQIIFNKKMKILQNMFLLVKWNKVKRFRWGWVKNIYFQFCKCWTWVMFHWVKWCCRNKWLNL